MGKALSSPPAAGGGVTLGVHNGLILERAEVLLPGIVYFSYRQTIAAYPGGGGSYTVARQNLGAMMISYVLVVADDRFANTVPGVYPGYPPRSASRVRR